MASNFDTNPVINDIEHSLALQDALVDGLVAAPDAGVTNRHLSDLEEFYSAVGISFPTRVTAVADEDDALAAFADAVAAGLFDEDHQDTVARQRAEMAALTMLPTRTSAAA